MDCPFFNEQREIVFPFLPTRDVTFIFPKPKEEMVGSFFIPEQFREQVSVGTVLAIGPGYYNKKGKFTPTTAKAGDLVLLNADIMELERKIEVEAPDGKKYEVMFCGEKDIQGIIEGNKLKPLFGKVFLESIKDKIEKSILWTPFTGYNNRGKVYSSSNSESIKDGDIVQYSIRYAMDVKFEDKSIISISEEQIEAILDEKTT